MLDEVKVVEIDHVREKLIDVLGRALYYAVENRKTENQKTIIATADIADYIIANDAYSYADHIIIPPINDRDLQELKDKLSGNGSIMIFPDCEPSVEIVPRWISVAERLPKPYTPVLTYRQSFGNNQPYAKVDQMALLYDDTPVWTDDLTTWKTVVTHWMPLPQPPKGE